MLKAFPSPTMHPTSSYGQPQQDYYDESSSSNGTGTQRKRLQRRATASENDDPSARSFLAPSFSSKPAPSQTNGAPTTHVRRRSTLMQNKATSLLGPRPLQGTKRITSESHLTSSSFGPIGGKRTTTGEALFGDPQSQPSASKFSFSTSDAVAWPHEETDSMADFLPSVNFDEFHTRLTTTRPDDTTSSSFSFDLPQPVQPRYDQSSPTRIAYDAPYTSNTRQNQRNIPSQQQQGTMSRSQSLLRKDVRNGLPTSAPGQNLGPSSSRTIPQPDAAAASTRTSTIAAATATRNSGRIPRKSVAPSASSSDYQFSGTTSTGSLSRSSSLLRTGQNKPAPRTILPPDHQYGDSSARAARTRSMQPPPPKQALGRLDLHGAQGTQSLLSSPVGMMPPTNAFDLSTLPQTPSSVGSRQSSLHVGGLGARTISPTDARRMKRLSMVNPAVPSLPSSSFMLQTEARAARRAAANSPASSVTLAARTSLTPSSSTRNTPDAVRKPVQLQPSSASGSTAVNTSSMRAPLPAPTNVRSSQIQAASRLPQPKTRNVHSSAGMPSEEVPPVPAIPKAYESPQDVDPSRASYFGVSRSIAGEMTSTLYDLTPQPSESEGTFYDEPVHLNTSQNSLASTRHRRGMTESSTNVPAPYGTAQNGQRRTLQPLMLPPLNLLPLDSSTNSRFATIPTPSDDLVLPAQTPPPRRQNAKTPSTPMTASKATFFARSTNFDEEPFLPTDFRANTSQHVFRPAALTNAALSPRTSTILPPDQSSLRGPSLTPLLSSSVPPEAHDKSAQHTPNLSQHQSHDVLLDSTSAWADAPAVLTPQLSRKDTSTSITDQSAANLTEPTTPGTATSLRRKLSLSWKRSSSKASQRIKAELFPSGKEAEARRQSKSKEMPPPKMPASANWKATTFSNSTSEYRNGRPSLDTKFRQSNSSVLSVARQPEAASRNPSRIDGAEQKNTATHARASSRSSSSLLNPVRNMLSSSRNSTINTLKARHLDINLDKDDLAADKIMEKLSTKRKDFEQAAKDVDELRKRASAKDKISPLQAIQNYALNIFERGEIIDYKEVYFCGTRNARKHIGDLDSQANNFGYDDERGDYNIVLGDHLAYRYEVVDVLGKGSFGQVVRCVDHKTGLLVAIKIIRNKKRFHQQALVEVDILQRLREWDPNNDHSMINFTQSFYFRGHLCISTELLSMNLYEFIKAHEFKGFPIALIRRFTKQMLSSLVLLKSKRVIHCDLKPENVLLVHPIHSEIKVIDFGSSCFENEKVYTYIQSRFYRSPEVILGMSYGLPIDMWSLGCILAELFTGYPIFPGENEQEQLACIMEIFGPPEKHIVEKSSRRKLFFDSMGKPRVTVSSKGRRRRPSSRTLQQALKCDDEAFLDFVARCLRWDPERRLKPEEALHHEYVTGVKRPAISNRSRTHPAPAVTAVAAAPSPVKRINTGSTPLKTGRDVSGPRALPESASFNDIASHKVGTNGISNTTLSKDSTTINAAANLAVKAAAANRRHSTIMPVQPISNSIGGVKRASGITATTGISSTSSSNLPRAAGLGGGAGGVSSYMPQQRSVSGKPDMAAAAAMASINVHRQQK